MKMNMKNISDTFITTRIRGNVGLPLANPNYRAIEKIENEFYTQDWGGRKKDKV